jgi:plastocyanin
VGVASTPAHVPAGGTIVGAITTQEPERPPLRATIDPSVCGSSLPDESLVRDAAGHLANVVIVVPGAKTPAAAEVQISNDRCRFVPHVGLLRPGGAVKMTSQDPVLHTMHASAADGRAFFNVSLPIPKMVASRTLDRPGPVTLSCSTHTWMRGYLYVTDELAAVSGADGRFRLEGVPAGTHELRIWHESLKAAAPVRVTVKEGETATVSFSMTR